MRVPFEKRDGPGLWRKVETGNIMVRRTGCSTNLLGVRVDDLPPMPQGG